MRSKIDIENLLLNPGVVAVVRARSADQVPPLAEALISNGVPAVEITMSTPKALDTIRRARKELGKRAIIGVGTVLTEDVCKGAVDAGAEFVVTPVTRPSFVKIAHSAGVPIMLGAYTPTEAQTAHEAGADFIKIFPADGLGPSYIKSLRAPLPHLRIVPTGGVDLNTITEFFKAGCAAVGVGSSLLTKAILDANDWKALGELAARFASAAKASKGWIASKAAEH
jgi:2-dehydro-3-deoxyphosphogluconate aldolase/(4S)-4-hydroxy-2-oxoglutarate aldolase